MGGGTIQVLGFPSNVCAENVKEFFERYTGEGTVYALKVRPPKAISPRSSTFVIIQFTTSSCAKDITAMANQRQLSYEGSVLKTRDAARDIVPNPRTTMFKLKPTTLHFGCQITDENFSALWSVSNVEVNFDFDLKKFKFLLSCHSVQYKLELFYGNIRQIQLRHSQGQAAKFLLIQLQAAPRIYKKPAISQSIYEDPNFNYFKEISSNHWVRATDFTLSSAIGQSSALCLEIPYGCRLPDIHENFVCFKEIEGQFVLESGFSFSHGLNLVPIVGPHQRIQLPYTILFKVNSLVQNGIIMGPTLDEDFFRLVDSRLVPIHYVEHALESLSHLKDSCFEPAKWLHEQYGKYHASRHPPKSTTISLDPGLVYVHRVQITPTKVYFCGPEVSISNRVLREYAEDIDNFLRVTFVDEDSEKIRSTDLVPRAVLANGEQHTDVYKRILSTLRNGIVIGDKKFEFLAFSSSQLKENSAWMFAARSGLDAAGIRKWMGDFSKIRNVAKYAARLGQSFGSSKESLSVDRHEIEHIPDIEIKNKKYNFSDGIGKISADFAKRVAIKCDIRGLTPSAFQIRYRGYKGVVAVDPVSPYKLSLRKSMLKYESDNTKLDVLGWSKYQPFFLNRQLITLLSTLGVRDHVFEMKQKEAVEQLDMILTDPIRTQEVLEVMSPGEDNQVLGEMLICGYKPDVEPFLSMMLQTFQASKLLELRTKTRIFVPKGRSMMGCLDETRTLKYGQVFVQISCVGRKQFDDNDPNGRNESNQGSILIKGRVLVAKCPCLHPGDVRVLRAVNVPALRHMVDCVVFPQKGNRPHPNECSGSDLDGDVYFVSWDSELIPPRQIPPMEYIAKPPVLLDHDVEIEEVQEYFTNYIVNDSFRLIANAHTVFADKEPLKANSDACIELAKLFSIAIDFSKTGIPAEIPPDLHVKKYPDFMEKPDKKTYESTRVIGKLFRAIKDIALQTSHIKSFTKEVAQQSYDPDMEFDGFKDYLDEACSYKDQYDFKLGNLMEYYGVKTEAEIISGNIMKLPKSFMSKKDDNFKVISLAVRSLKKEVRGWFYGKGSEAGPPTDNEAYAKASAWYHVTYHPDYFGTYNEGLKRDHFISFPWCIYEKLIDIKQNKSREVEVLSS